MPAVLRWGAVAWIVARLLAALPMRALAWLFLLAGLLGNRIAWLFAWAADLIEGVR